MTEDEEREARRLRYDESILKQRTREFEQNRREKALEFALRVSSMPDYEYTIRAAAAIYKYLDPEQPI